MFLFVLLPNFSGFRNCVLKFLSNLLFSIPNHLIQMKKISLLLTLALLSSITIGQRTNFSGTWNINREKSELNDQFSMAPNSLMLDQSRKELSIQRNSSWQGQDFSYTDTFTLDGKECENVGFMDMIKKSTANWNDDKKSIMITSTIEMQDGSEMTITENLSLDGDNLVLHTSASSSYGEMSEVFVFDKQ